LIAQCARPYAPNQRTRTLKPLGKLHTPYADRSKTSMIDQVGSGRRFEFVTSADQPRASRRTSFSRLVGPFVRSTDDGCGVGGDGDDDDAAAMSPPAHAATS
jgi:hypothetical protein